MKTNSFTVPDGYAVSYEYWDGWPICADCQMGNQNGPLLKKIETLEKQKCTKCGNPMINAAAAVPAAHEAQGVDARDAVAKAIADVVGHGMREKCYTHADAAIAAMQSGGEG